MKNDATLRTRREFLRTTVLGGALSYTIPAFLANTFSALQVDTPSFRSATIIITAPVRILVWQPRRS
jgi:hypothetical protein